MTGADAMTQALVNPALLRWARERSGLGIQPSLKPMVGSRTERYDLSSRRQHLHQSEKPLLSL